jgi:hypothetical protein
MCVNIACFHLGQCNLVEVQDALSNPFGSSLGSNLQLPLPPGAAFEYTKKATKTIKERTTTEIACLQPATGITLLVYLGMNFAVGPQLFE